ncbi:zonular occludens toxin domain-containing protein [Pseudomonas aeruginosa]|uniref:zonular occludens toxin domain-containing protein n=1 Tax=Pseudomonas aeruginosa TaxID=287 RepID=UPI0026586377|nr:zonular occludens toxin domain-containing protein [Pseudomonas aeruginosa]
MAIEYHEGLPGAGKSYEAVVFHIIPALKSRRSVVTNIRGMNYERLSELTGEPLEMIKLLLINVEPAEQDSADGEVQRCINEMCDKTPDNTRLLFGMRFRIIFLLAMPSFH